MRVDGVAKTFREGESETHVLHGVGLELARGETTSLVGRSGSGKSTLISLLAGLLLPDAGTVVFDGCDVTALDDGRARAPARATHRRRAAARQPDPVPERVENVELAMALAGGGGATRARPRPARGARSRRGGSTTARAGSRAGRRSASPSRWRSPTSPTCCSPTR